MTVYTDEVNIYNTDAIAQDIQEAHDAHKAYITEVSADNGIVVAAAGKGTVNGAITSATTGWHLADVLEFVKQGVSRFWIGLKNTTDSTPTVRIGKEYVSGATDNESHMELDFHSIQMLDKDNSTYFHVSDLRTSSGIATVSKAFRGDDITETFYLDMPATGTNYTVVVKDADGNTVTPTPSYTPSATQIEFASALPAGYSAEVTYTTTSSNAKAFTFGNRALTQNNVGAGSVSFGFGNIAGEMCSFAEGYETEANGGAAHAEGQETHALGETSHAEGFDTHALGYGSHAEGSGTWARDYADHAEGGGSQASGSNSHAEGFFTKAKGFHSHSEGYKSMAKGFASHAQNEETIAGKMSQTVIGTFNVEDTTTAAVHPGDVRYDTDRYGKYALIVGNGTSDTDRSNAFAVDWNGNTETAGHYYAEGLKVGHSWCYINSITDTSITAKETDKKVPVNSLNQAKPSGAFEYVSSSKSVKCNVAGWYMVSIQAGFDNTATMSDDLVGIGVARVHSGTTDNIAGPDYVRVRTNLDRALLMPTPVYFYAGDTFYPVVRNNSNARGVLHTMRFMVAPLIG